MAEIQTPSSWTLHLKTANDYGVWTGGANPQKMDSLKTTSVTGGLRFWTDALLRAEGRACCTEQGRCSYRGGKSVCPTCAIFGCTGLSRAFTVRTETPDFALDFDKGTLEVPLGKFVCNTSLGRQKPPKYYLTKGYCGPITLSLSMRRPHNGAFTLPPEVLTALYLMLEYGTFGAYDQYGCGQVNMDEDEKKELREACSAWKTEDRPADTGGVTLRDFFFFKGVTEDQNRQEVMCEIRHDIRNRLRALSLPDTVATKLRHWFCGALRNPAGGTNYAYSIDPQTGQVYGWGHFARAGVEFAKFREAAVSAVWDTVRKKCTGNSFVWKEFGSPRDPSSPREWPGYLASLISTEWRQK